MKKLFLLLLLLASAPAFPQTDTAVVGNAKTVVVDATNVLNARIRFEVRSTALDGSSIQGCPAGDLHVSGGGIIFNPYFDFAPDASGNVNPAANRLYLSSALLCGTTANTFYRIYAIYNGRTTTYGDFIIDSTHNTTGCPGACSFNLNTVTAIGTYPPVNSIGTVGPTGPAGPISATGGSGGELQKRVDSLTLGAVPCSSSDSNGVIQAAGINGAFFTGCRAEANIGARIAAVYDNWCGSVCIINAAEFSGGVIATDVFSSRTAKQVHLLLGAGSYTFSANTTMPANWIPQFLGNGGQISPASGITVTLTNRPIAGDTQQIVADYAPGSRTVRTGSGQVSPWWYGSNVSDATVGYHALQNAVDGLCSMIATNGGDGHRTLYIPATLYNAAHWIKQTCELEVRGEGGFGYSALIRGQFWGTGLWYVIGPNSQYASVPLDAPLLGTGNSFHVQNGVYFNLIDVAPLLGVGGGFHNTGPNYLDGLVDLTIQTSIKLKSLATGDGNTIFYSVGGGGPAVPATSAARLFIDGGTGGHAAGTLVCTLNVAGTNKTVAGGTINDTTTRHHGACVKDSTASLLRLFVDGVQVNTVAATGAIQQGVLENMNLGQDSQGLDYVANTNAIDADVQGFEIAKTARYNSGSSFTPPSTVAAADSNTLALLNFASDEDITTLVQTLAGSAWVWMRRDNYGRQFGTQVFENLNLDGGLISVGQPGSSFRHVTITPGKMPYGLFAWHDNYLSAFDHITVQVPTTGRCALCMNGANGIIDVKVNTIASPVHIWIDGGFSGTIRNSYLAGGTPTRYGIIANGISGSANNALNIVDNSFSAESGVQGGVFVTQLAVSAVQVLRIAGNVFETGDLANVDHPAIYLAQGTNSRVTHIEDNEYAGVAGTPAASIIHGVGTQLGIMEISRWTSFGMPVNIPVTDFTVPVGGKVQSGQDYAVNSMTAAAFNTLTNCASSASPAVCAAAPAGAVAVPAGTNPTLVVNTTKVTANSQIVATEDQTLGTRLGVTCNTTLPTGAVSVTARTAGTSFTIAVVGVFTTNPVCVSYTITN